ncbi:MAG: hypothetical protein DRH90_20360, partial [Deltaproteobacteria bacterium]
TSPSDALTLKPSGFCNTGANYKIIKSLYLSVVWLSIQHEYFMPAGGILIFMIHINLLNLYMGEYGGRKSLTLKHLII